MTSLSRRRSKTRHYDTSRRVVSTPFYVFAQSQFGDRLNSQICFVAWLNPSGQITG